MNLKPNLWTALFIISTLALIYVVSTNKSSDLSHEAKTVEPAVKAEVSLSDTIPATVALGRISQYATRVVARLTESNINSSAGVVNANVLMFKLESSELAQMVSLFGGQDVYAIMSVEGTTMTRDVVDLIFSDMDPTGAVQGKFFDFSSPCPPLCN